MKRVTFLPTFSGRLCGIMILTLGSAPAAVPPPTSPDRAILNAQIEAREKRADMLLDEIRATDSRIENGIDTLLDALRSVGDTKNSGSKVVRMKEQTIDALRKNLAYFDQRRAALKGELRRPTLHLSEEEKRRAVTKFDGRIEKRVRQILA